MTSPWVHAARLGQAAWLVGNAYESVVGVPELLADAQEQRRPGVLEVGSPVRFYAPVASLALVATARVLSEHARRADHCSPGPSRSTRSRADALCGAGTTATQPGWAVCLPGRPRSPG